MKMSFYKCEVCGKIVALFPDRGVPTICCGRTMTKLEPNKVDASAEKHVPVFSKIGDTVYVKIGSDPHPMTDMHSIAWIGLQTTTGFQFRELHPGDLPQADFELLSEDKVEAVYAYCNLHGLWCCEG